MPGAIPLNANWLRRYLGLPFRDRGRDRKGVDCWGLVQLAFLEQLGIALPSYLEETRSGVLAIARIMRSESRTSAWDRIDASAERAFDVVLMNGIVEDERGRIARAPVHVGMVTKPGHLLHVERGINSVHVAFRDGRRVKANPFMLNRVIAIFRHEAIL